MKHTRILLSLALLATLSMDLPGATPAPLVAVITTGPIASPAAPTVNVPATFSVTATGTALRYGWDFGDGTVIAIGAAGSGASIQHTYAAPGHYTVTASVDETPTSGVVTSTLNVTVHWPLPTMAPTNSSTIILDQINNRVWVVNPDQDNVSIIDAATDTKIQDVPVGKNPRTLARAADGSIWVVSQQHPSISVIQPVPPYALQHVVPLPHGSLPYGICMSPDGASAFVSFQGSGGVSRISTATRTVVATTTSPPSARGIAVSSSGRVFVTRFISQVEPPLTLAAQAASHGEVWEFNSSLGHVRTFNLVIDPGPGTVPDPDSSSPPPPPAQVAIGSRGIPNYLTSLVLTPDERRAWVPSKKDNIQRGTSTMRDGRIPGPETSYRAIVSSLDLVNNVEPALGVLATQERFDIDNSEMPQAACVSPLGDYLFVALQGSNTIQIRDLMPIPAPPFAFPPSINGNGDLIPAGGLSPQGLVLNPANNKLYVQNYMSRTVTVFNVSNILNRTQTSLLTPTPLLVTTIVTVLPGSDLLAANNVLKGKQIFYNAGDPKMSLNGYIGCAGCHLDGGADMRVWDFTNRGEGLRNTIMLQGRGTGTAMKHGNVHWDANFDEIQDFENDIQNAFGGTGFSGGAAFAPMGAPNAGRSADLDALAAYVNSLDKVSRSPFRNVDGTLTALGAAGEAVFKAKNCQQCHGGREFTDSAIFTLAVPNLPAPPASPHDVGTGAGEKRLGNANTRFDTPTLKGVWQTAPYLHNGAAATLEDVFTDASAAAHFGFTPTATEAQQLAQYMREIDEIDAPPVPSGQTNLVTLGAIATGRPYSLAATGTAPNVLLPFIDRSYTIGTIPALLQNKILLRTAEDDKDYSGASLISFTLTNAGDVYVFLDNRKTSDPTWLTGWTADAPRNLSVAPGQTMLAYKRTFAAGSVVTLGGNQQGGATGALRNFFAIIDLAAGANYEEGPLSKFEWVHDRDADGDGLHDEYEAVSTLDPWKPNTGGGGTPDEDKIAAGTTTRFQDQIAFEYVPPALGGGGGGSGGCGLGGLEFLIPLALLRLRRRRS